MKVRYDNLHVEVVPETRMVEASVRCRNGSGETWRGGEGFAFGYQIFDPETDTLVVDGERVAPAADVAPGDTTDWRLTFALPPEPGHYRVFLSPMRENVAWLYQRGWPFVLVDAVVEEGRARIDRVRSATPRTMAGERLRRGLRRAFALPFTTLWDNRSLIRIMVRRDVLGRYRGSFGGAGWTVLTPLLLMLTYFFVFGIVLNTRFAGDASRSGFALYFLAGMLPWLAFSEAAGRAPSLLHEHRNFVKKLVFPVETLPANLTVAGLSTQAIAVVLYLAALALARGAVPPTALWIPVLIVPQVLFTLGVCWFLAALGVFVRDLGQVIGFLLTLWFFLTPICYPEASLPPAALPWLAANPLFVLVRAFREVLLEGRAPALLPLAKLYAVSALVFFAGHAWFYKLRRSFADVV